MTTTAAYRRREVVVLVLGGAATVHFSHAFVKLAFQTQSVNERACKFRHSHKYMCEYVFKSCNILDF